MKETTTLEEAPVRDLDIDQAVGEPPGEAQAVGLSIVAAVIIGSFFLRMAGAGNSASVQLYLKELTGLGQNVSSFTVSLVYAAFYATELLLSPVFGGLSDRVGRKRMMVLGPVFGFLAAQLFPFTTLLPLLMLGQALQGAGTAANVPSSLGYLADITARSPNRSRLMGLFEIASLIGIVAGPSAASFLWDSFGPNTFRINSLLFLVAGAIFWFGLHDVVATQQGRRSVRDYLRIMLDGRLMRFVPAWLMVNAVFAIWTVHTIYQLKANEALPVSNQRLVGAFSGADISQIYLVCGATFLAGLLYWSFRAATLRRTTVMLYGLGGTFAMAAFLYLLNHAYIFDGIALIQPWMLFVLFLAALFFQSAFTPVALAYLADVSEHHPADRGIVMGLYSIFLGVGQLLGNFVGGWFANIAALDGLVVATVLATLLATGNVLLLRRDDPPPDARRTMRANLH